MRVEVMDPMEVEAEELVSDKIATYFMFLYIYNIFIVSTGYGYETGDGGLAINGGGKGGDKYPMYNYLLFVVLNNLFQREAGETI